MIIAKFSNAFILQYMMIYWLLRIDAETSATAASCFTCSGAWGWSIFTAQKNERNWQCIQNGLHNDQSYSELLLHNTSSVKVKIRLFYSPKNHGRSVQEQPDGVFSPQPSVEAVTWMVGKLSNKWTEDMPLGASPSSFTEHRDGPHIFSFTHPGTN